jgi:hypothetical protein
VASNIIRLRNRRAELETVLRHMRTHTTAAPRELVPIQWQPAHEADATSSESQCPPVTPDCKLEPVAAGAATEGSSARGRSPALSAS